jgi:hypothetical protein
MNELPPLPRRRLARIIITESGGKVIVTEQQTSMQFAMIEKHGSEHAVTLTILEARALADDLQRTCRRIITRPDSAP